MSQLFQDDGEKATGQKVCLATTSYDNPDASYTFSLQRSREALHKAGIQTAYLLLSGNCHVDDARNVIVQEFLLSDCTDLVFLDADVSWDAVDLVKLCQYDVDMVGGVYPFRREDKRGDMPVRMKVGVYDIDTDGLLEVEGVPSGFMRIKREVIEKLEPHVETYWNKKDKRRKVPIMFEREYDRSTETRWGGDLAFCNKVTGIGFKIFAACEMRLGHTAKHIIKDSLGGVLRRRAGTTLHHVACQVRDRKETALMYEEARDYIGNEFTAREDVLMLCVIMARKADGPIIETGSGLTTILMAAANPKQTVWCIEHDPLYAEKLRRMAHEAGVSNIAICTQPIKNGWYDLSDLEDKLPLEFALGLNDGPPRTIGPRMGFFTHLSERVETIICDDADDPGYKEALQGWAQGNDRRIDFIEPRAALIRSKKEEVENAIPG